MALKESTTIGKTNIPNKYTRINYSRFDYPDRTAVGLQEYIDKESADSGGPILDKHEFIFPNDYVFTDEEWDAAMAAVGEERTLRNIGAALMYILIKKDERFKDMLDA